MLYHAKPFPILKKDEQTLKKKVCRLIKIGVLKIINTSQWVAPTFIIPRINGTVRLISEFRPLNKTKKQNLFQSLHIQD